jgi:hypothetical protein
MINESAVIEQETLKVIDGITLEGGVNVPDETILANVASAIRRPYPQIRPQPIQGERIALVGGGPSLAETERELIDLVQSGAKLVTVNGAYQWCLDRNLFPRTQIVMDARPSNARFVDPAIPRCNYLLASQAAPETWDAVDGRPDVWMFHAAAGSDGPLKDLLDTHYLSRWYGVGGGTTVATRALSVLRTLGYVRFDLFGIDSCFLNGQHHAYEQAENAKDKPLAFTISMNGEPGTERVFHCAPWHVKQFEDFLQMVKVNGEHFLLNIHGRGLLAYALACGAGLEWHTHDT